MFYAGNDFESAKEYKTFEGAKKAADKNGYIVYDEDMNQIYPEAAAADPEEETATEAAADPEETTETSADPEETAEPKEEAVHGKIRRVFNGKLRLRRVPSYDKSTICGVTSFITKEVTKKVTTPEGVLYQTIDGYFVSGDPKNVEFIAEE